MLRSSGKHYSDELARPLGAQDTRYPHKIAASLGSNTHHLYVQTMSASNQTTGLMEVTRTLIRNSLGTAIPTPPWTKHEIIFIS